MSLVITGCQRSGTGYTATVLSAAGHWCGHERHYRIGSEPPRTDVIEASHMALPVLTGETVVWQLRHPLSVAASMMGRGTIRPSRPPKLPPSGRWTIRLLPHLTREPTHVERVLRYWHDWNRRVEARAHCWWRVEDVTVDQLADALDLAGYTPNRDRLTRALALVPTDANGTAHRRLTWGDVPEGPTKRDALQLAAEVGYL